MCSWKCANPNSVSSNDPALTDNAAPASSASRSLTRATSRPLANFNKRYCLLSTAGLLKAESSTKISVFDDGAVVSVVAVNGRSGRLTMLCLKPREGVCRGRVDSVMSAVTINA